MNRDLLNLIAAVCGVDQADYQNDSVLEHVVLQFLTSNEGGVEITTLEPLASSVAAVADGTTTPAD